MTNHDQDDTSGIDENTRERLRVIGAELSAAGLAIQLHHTQAGLDLTATLHHSGRHETDVIVDEDGYTELHYWADPAATPAQAANAIVTALAAVTPDLARSAHHGQEQTVLHSASTTPGHTPPRANEPITGYDGAVTERAGDGGMAKPKDTPTGETTNPDSVTSWSPEQVHPEIVKRLENLEHGHPSSPYNADHTPKPPVPNPFAGDYPIPGDPDYPDAPNGPESPATSDTTMTDHTPRPEGVPDQGLPTEDKPVIGPDGSWKWKGCKLTPHQSLCGDQGVSSCLEAEGRDADGRYADHGLTPAMRRIEAQLDHGKLAPETEKYALKGVDRFKEKLSELIGAEPDKAPEELVKEIHDGIRYTFLLNPEDYMDGVREIGSALEADGYELGVIKNAWDNDEYKGVNTRWLDYRSGLRFEVQFHTEHSWQVKQQTHDAYEKINDTRTPLEERERLRIYQREANAGVASPPRWDEILDYRREGW